MHKFIIDNLPENYEQMFYGEMFGGGLSVLLNKSKSQIEIANDINPSLYWLYYHIKYNLPEFQRYVNLIEYNKENFEQAKNYKLTYDYQKNVYQSVMFFVKLRFSRSGSGQEFSFSERTRGGQPGDVNSWETIKKELPKVKERLENVILTNLDFRVLLEQYNDKHWIFYNDPTYVHSTRTSDDLFDYEMTDNDHRDMARLCKKSKAKIMISGYPSPLYDSLFSDWRVVQKEVKNNMGQGKVKNKRVEMLWMNY